MKHILVLISCLNLLFKASCFSQSFFRPYVTPSRSLEKLSNLGASMEQELTDSELIDLIEVSKADDHNKMHLLTKSKPTNLTINATATTISITNKTSNISSLHLKSQKAETSTVKYHGKENVDFFKSLLYESTAKSNEDEYDDVYNQPEYSYPFNKSIIIVWKKNNNKNFRATIFSSRLDNEEILTVWFYSTINSIVFETSKSKIGSNYKILRLESLTFDYMYFSFDESHKLGVYLDCPSLSNQKLEYDHYAFSLMNDLKIAYGVALYNKLETAMKANGCKIITSVHPSVVLYFNTNLTLFNSVLLFSFANNGYSYSMIYFNGVFKLISSNGLTIAISEESFKNPITAENGVYFLFKLNSVELYTSCPANQEPLFEWSTSYFNKKTQIETSLDFQIGSALISKLLEKFCFTKFLTETSQTSKYVPTRLLNLYLENINKISSFMELFLPLGNKIDKLKEFKYTPGFNLNFLSRPEIKILIASRVYAKRGFFDRSIKEYATGFSDGGNNFWIGLNVLHKVTQKHSYKLRIEVFNDSKSITEEYGLFKVDSEENKYKLNIGSLRSGVNPFFELHDQSEFSTFDYGNQRFLALKYSGGFWHRTTFNSSTLDFFYCFSCEDDYNSYGSSCTQTISYTSVKSYSTKMYLVF